MINLILGISPNDIIYGLSIDIEISNHAIAFGDDVTIRAYIPIEELAQPMVAFRVGSHAHLSRPFCHTTVSGIDSAEAIPSESRTLVEIDEVVLPPFESLQHLALGLVCYVGNVYTRARREIHVRVAALHHINIAAVHLLELIENTSTRFQVTKIVTQEHRTKLGIQGWLSYAQHRARALTRGYASTSDNEIKVATHELLLKALKRSYYVLFLSHIIYYIAQK